MRHLPARPLILPLGIASLLLCSWAPLAPGPPPRAAAPSTIAQWSMVTSQGPGLFTPAVICDPEARRALMIGGGGSDYSNAVWTMALQHDAPWSLLATQGTPPSPRRSLAAIYDPKGHRAIVYGGFDGNFLGGLWQLSLGPDPTWSPIEAQGEAPPPLAASAAVYDSKRDRMLLIHGNDGVPPAFRNGGIWALELSGRPRWRALSPLGGGPAPRSAHSAIYDARRDRVIVFGGSTPAFSDELWELLLEGRGQWIRLAMKRPRPGPREEHGAVYDPAGDEMIVYGGASRAGGMETEYGNGALPADWPYLNDAWALSLGDEPHWRRLPDGPDGLGRWGHRATFDPVTRRMIVAGGWGSLGSTLALSIGSPVAKTVPPAQTAATPPTVGLPLRLGMHVANPARGALMVRLALPAADGARLELFDIVGRRVASRDLSDLGAGNVRYRWDATSRLHAGMYLLRLSRAKEVVKTKVILLR